MRNEALERQKQLEYEMAVEQMISEGGPVYDNIEKYLKRIRTQENKTENLDTVQKEH